MVGQNLTNTGAIVNNGTLAIQGAALNDGGTIDSYGEIVYQGQAEPGFVNSNGGGITIREDGQFRFHREGSSEPRSLFNEENSVVDNFGSIVNSGIGGFVIENDGSIYNECNATISVPVQGNPTIDNCNVPPEEHAITISSIDLNSNSISDLWTTVRSVDDTLLKSGFTPLEFTGESGTSYKVTVASFDGRIFHHWQDDSSTNKSRMVNLTEDTDLVAVYDAGDSLRGYTSLTYTGTEEQPDLTVNALSLDGSRSLRMWTIIDPQPNEELGTADSSDDEPTITISSDADYDALVVQEDDVLLIEAGVVVDVTAFTNYGKIINYGTLRVDPFAGVACEGCPPGTYPPPMVNEGVIENYGTLAPPGHGTTYNNGTIVIKEGGVMSLARVSSAAPGKLVNGEDAVIDNFGLVTAPLYGNHRVSVENNGAMYRECTGTYDLPSSVPGPGLGIFTGNPIVDACNADTTYKVYASNYKDRVFDHWEDGSTERIRTLTIGEATTITAYYKTG